LKNSIKYTKEGKILVGLEKKNNTIELYVKDNGVGIPKRIKRIYSLKADEEKTLLK